MTTKQGAGMALTVNQAGDVTVAAVGYDQIDVGNADEFRQEVIGVIPSSAKLVLDLGRVTFIDSRGCGAILSCLKHVSAAGGDLKLCGVAPAVRTVFELIRLHRICDILDTPEAAVRAFGT